MRTKATLSGWSQVTAFYNLHTFDIECWRVMGGCEVVEIASPSEHPTFIEHNITLPTNVINADRDFGGQRFSFDRADDMDWFDHGSGWQTRSTGIAEATNDLAAVTVIRSTTSGATRSGSHEGELLMFYVLEGSATVTCEGSVSEIASDDSVAIPPDKPWDLTATSDDFQALVVNVTGPKERAGGEP